MKIDPADMQYWIFGAALFVLVAAIAWTLSQRHQDAHSHFRFDDLLLDPKTRQTSPARCVMMGSFAATTFVIIYGVFLHTLSDAVFAAYVAGWVAPAVAKIITDGGVEKAAAAPRSAGHRDRQQRDDERAEARPMTFVVHHLTGFETGQSIPHVRHF